ncbi:MAG: hypothetical protein KDF60_12490 [Calditrichaeota bacterium]|nr:hypothetical protein [Calditrichota bacterium]
MELNNFWIALIIFVLAGHFIWFIFYAIKLLKSDPGNISTPKANNDNQNPEK